MTAICPPNSGASGSSTGCSGTLLEADAAPTGLFARLAGPGRPRRYGRIDPGPMREQVFGYGDDSSKTAYAQTGTYLQSGLGCLRRS